MEWNIKFNIPDDTDRLIFINGYRRQQIEASITEAIRSILANEVQLSVAADIQAINPDISRPEFDED